jgi:TRAP transporter 4TM/12TM fusion protein
MRTLSGFWGMAVKLLSYSLIAFQLYTTGMGPFSDIIQRSIHLSFVLTLVFLLKPPFKLKDGEAQTSVPLYDVALALISCASCVYLTMIARDILYDPLQWISWFDKAGAVALVFLVLEASRRSVGWTFPVLGLTFLFYAFCGELFPGIWGHQNFSFNMVFQTFYHNTRGIWGTMLGLSATMLAMFAIFGAILSGTGGAETFIRMGQRFTGQSVGGSGKVAVVASSLFGMISGSAIGNVVATGVFTIPSMKKAGYSREWAACIEAVASTGGQIMPPVMGAAAFIMAQLIGVNYIYIAKAAVVPAVLYYVSCFISIHLISLRYKIKGTDEKPNIAVGDYIVILVPLALFLVFLFLGYTVTIGAFYATLGALAIFVLRFAVTSGISIPRIVGKTADLCRHTAENGTKGIVEMCGILAGAQITISLINLTGFGVKLSDVIVSIGQGDIFLCLVCSMVVCIILGMGLPTTAAYVLGASVLAPPLIVLGVKPLVAHLFVMYYACLSAITPPVCVAVFMAAGLAKANWFKVGIIACSVALPAFVIPYTFHYNPALILEGPVADVVVGIVTALMGVFFIDVGVTGFVRARVNAVLRSALLAGGLLLLIPSLLWSAVGFAVGGAAFAVVWATGGKKAVEA